MPKSAAAFYRKDAKNYINNHLPFQKVVHIRIHVPFCCFGELYIIICYVFLNGCLHMSVTFFCITVIVEAF